MPNKADNSMPLMEKNFLHSFVEKFFSRRQYFLKAVEKFGSPLYILEVDMLKKKAMQFRKAFENTLSKTAFYYAMKSNNLPYISEVMLDQGYGIDVSSGAELKCALGLGARDVIFSGPGKTDNELELASDNNDRVTILLDSFGELKRLIAILNRKKKPLAVGVRLNNNPEGLWKKFGILPEELNLFYEKIRACPYIEFKGLQFHSSWNLNPDRQIEFIHILGDLMGKLPSRLLDSCEFIDIGGGYWPYQGEWLLSGEPFKNYRKPADPIKIFAEKLSDALKNKILPLTDSRIYFEPGRWICNDAMHILVRVIDKKNNDLVITDAGTNSVGWERFETDYFPVLNLTNNAVKESACTILGSLCTPHDVWGYTYFGKNIQEGDILMIPTQGAYTYSLRQHFIKPLPEVIAVEESGNYFSL